MSEKIPDPFWDGSSDPKGQQSPGDQSKPEVKATRATTPGPHYHQPRHAPPSGGMTKAIVGLSIAIALCSSWWFSWRNTKTPLQAKPFIPLVISKPTPPLDSDFSTEEKRTIQVFREASPAVVYITAITVRQDPFRRNAMAIPQGTGSGFIWDKAGHIVTNYHVIRAGDAVHVTLADQSQFPATLVGQAPDKDIAVLRIEAPVSKLSPLARGSSYKLVVGQHVLAIGNPFGLDHTLSTGVISGLGREIKSLAGRPILGVIQTDAAINPGNSGGPLLDSGGRLIGMNTAIYSPSGASAGIGFAVPVDTILRIVPQLIEHGRVTRPGLGVQIAEAHIAERAGVDGVVILGIIPNSPAEQAGLHAPTRSPLSGRTRIGDVIVAINDTEVHEPNDLFRSLDGMNVGDVVRVTLEYRKQRRTVELKLEELGD